MITKLPFIAAALFATDVATAEAKDLKVLHAFRGGKDGASPIGLIADGQGNFYGATRAGGKGSCNNGAGCGTVFKIAADGKKTTLYAFTGKKDGGAPIGNLARGPDGSLYGANNVGGILCPHQSVVGCGRIFKIDPDGTETTLHQFKGGTDGFTPMAGVTLDAVGNIYGTTQQGGSDDCGCGIVFKLTPTGAETILHSFTGGADGYYPAGGLAFDKSGNLYGTTQDEGTGCSVACGTLFKIKPNGAKSIVHTFALDNVDGTVPTGGLAFDDKGTLWGTTSEGGNYISGTLYKVTRDGAETVLWSFGADKDGWDPNGVVFDDVGSLYGTLSTDSGGGPGMIFKYAIADQRESIVYAFPGPPAGRYPSGLLAFDAAGHLLGTTYSGGKQGQGCGSNGCGEVFRLPVP